MGTQNSPAGAAPVAQVGDVTVQIARWFDDKAAAVSVRLEDSQREPAAPLLERYGIEVTCEGDAPAHQVMAVSDLDAFSARLDKIIEDGSSVCFHFGAVGEPLLRDMLAALYGSRRQVWFARVYQILEYEREREAATVAAELVGDHKLKIDVNCRIDQGVYDQPLTLRVDLPRDWSGDDVQALDAAENPISIRRTTEQWNRPLITIPPRAGTYYVHLVDPLGGRPAPALPDESERTVQDAATGLGATVCKWFDGRAAAHSIRFDDAHATHILHVIPLLREYGYRGTFMINPGKPQYENHRDAWEACAARGDQEFANHTHHHRGCTDDEDADRELGDTARYIWSLFPNRSKLLALARGGATTWNTTTPFRHWADKYHLIRTGGGSLSMADEYGPRLPLFRRRLAQALEDGAWFQTHYHAIGEGHLSMTEENFATVLEITKQHEDQLWISGMADIYKYQQERDSASLQLTGDGPARATLRLRSGTDPELYDQPLTIQLSLPDTWSAEAVKVKDPDGNTVATRTATADGRTVLRFEAAPIEAAYSIVGG